MNACKESVTRSPPRKSRSTSGAPASAVSHQVAQRVGNQMLQHLLRHQLLQAKCTVSHPADISEQEADRVADEVMRMPEPTESRAGLNPRSDPPPVQRMCPECEERLQPKALVEE